MVVRNNTSQTRDSVEMCTPVTEVLRTLTTKGHQSLVTYDQHMLVPYYGNGNARLVSDPMVTVSTRDRSLRISWAVSFGGCRDSAQGVVARRRFPAAGPRWDRPGARLRRSTHQRFFPMR